MNKISDAAQSFRVLTEGLQEKAKQSQQTFADTKPKKEFAEFLKDQIGQVNTDQTKADQLSTELATGKQEDIHETMLAVAKAELSFNLMVQIRNKALEAYQEVMRMPV